MGQLVEGQCSQGGIGSIAIARHGPNEKLNNPRCLPASLLDNRVGRASPAVDQRGGYLVETLRPLIDQLQGPAARKEALRLAAGKHGEVADIEFRQAGKAREKPGSVV